MGGATDWEKNLKKKSMDNIEMDDGMRLFVLDSQLNWNFHVLHQM